MPLSFNERKRPTLSKRCHAESLSLGLHLGPLQLELDHECTIKLIRVGRDDPLTFLRLYYMWQEFARWVNCFRFEGQQGSMECFPLSDF
jgi:hypothetical protein